MKKYKCINPCELTAAITAAGNVMAKKLSDDELNLLAAAFMQLADVLATIAAVRDINANQQEQQKQAEQKASECTAS